MPFTTTSVRVVILDNGAYTLTADVVYAGRDSEITVPAGFQTDLASVPQFLTWLVPVAGAQDRAAIVHDWLCTELGRVHDQTAQGYPNVPPAPASGRDTDGIFRRILREDHVPTVRRWLFFVGVRWGALFSPARRAGWVQDAPAVLIVSLLALPVVLPASILVGAGLLMYTVAEAAAKVVGRVRAAKA